MGFFDFLTGGNKGPDYNINEAADYLKKDPAAILLDVRETDEYADGHIPGSMNIPLSVIRSVPVNLPEKGTPVYVYCQSGMRSGKAADFLKQQGFTDVRDLGGISR